LSTLDAFLPDIGKLFANVASFLHASLWFNQGISSDKKLIHSPPGPALLLGQLGGRLERSSQGGAESDYFWFPYPECFTVTCNGSANIEACLGSRTVSIRLCTQLCIAKLQTLCDSNMLL